jgi:hypothetical protein
MRGASEAPRFLEMKMKNLLRLLIAISILLPSSALKALNTAGADPFLGTWVLNVQKSAYPADTCPKRMVIEMEKDGDGVRYRSSAWYANGATSFSHYSAKYDEREVLVQGSNGFLLPVSLKRIAADTVVATYKRGMQPVATSRREVSADGQVMTITTVVTGKDGRSVTTIGVYERSTQHSAFSHETFSGDQKILTRGSRFSIPHHSVSLAEC